MAFIPDETIEKIKDSASIVDLIGQYVDLEKRGSNYFGLCPFVPEDTPSFSVNEDKKIYKCFSCGRSGNIFSFLMEYKGMEFPTAVAEVGKTVGINVSVDTSKSASRLTDRQRELINVNNRAALAMTYALETPDAQPAVDYLKNKRHFSEDTIKKFQLGFNSNSWDIFKWLELEKIPLVDAIESGLISRDDKGEVHNRFINRIIFPLVDEYGNTVAFAGRTLDKQVAAKYLNGSDTDIFHKSTFLFNLKNAKQEVGMSKRLLLLEGYADVVSSDSAGVRFGIASMGTSLTKEQVQIIARHVKAIQIAYDGDSAGQDATMRAIQLIKQTNSELDIQVSVFPEELDPDEYIQKYGAEKYVDFINNATITPNEFAVNYFKKDKNLNSEQDLIEYVNQISKFAGSSSELQRNVLLNSIVKITGLDANVIKGIFDQNKATYNQGNSQYQNGPSYDERPIQSYAPQDTGNPEVVSVQTTIAPIQPTTDEKTERERTLIASALQNPEMKKIVFDSGYMFNTEKNQKILLLLKGTPLGVSFIDSVPDVALKIHIESLLKNSKYVLKKLDAVREQLFYLQEVIPVQEKIKSLENDIEQAKIINENKKVLDLTQEIMNLRKVLKEKTWQS